MPLLPSGLAVLSMAGAVGLFFNRPKKDLPPHADNNPERDDSTLAVREKMRQAHGVELVAPDLEGTNIAALPAGTYGFTYAVTSPDAGLFRRRTYHSYELHHARDGELYLIGFVSPSDAADYEYTGELREGNVFPDPVEGAASAISIPLSNVLRISGPRRDQQNAVRIEVRSKVHAA